MATHLLYSKQFQSTNVGSTSGTQELPELLNLSHYSQLLCVLVTNAAGGGDAGDTLNVYIQSRGKEGVWNDRVAFTQLLGTVSSGEVIEANLQGLVTLDSGEELGEPSGSTGASRLTAGTVRNGTFPGLYRTTPSSVGGLGVGASWRIQWVTVDSDADFDPDYTVYIYGSE